MATQLFTPRLTTLICASGIIVSALMTMLGERWAIAASVADAAAGPLALGVLLLLAAGGLIALAFRHRPAALGAALALLAVPMLELINRFTDLPALQPLLSGIDVSSSSPALLIGVALIGIAIGRIALLGERAGSWRDLDAIAAIITVLAILGTCVSTITAMADYSLAHLFRMSPAAGGALLLAAGGLQGVAWQSSHRPGEPSTRLSVIVAAASVGASLALYHVAHSSNFQSLLASLPIPEILLGAGIVAGLLTSAALFAWQIATHHSVSSSSAHQALDTEHAYLVEMLETVESGVLTCDAQSRLTHFNPAMQRLYGLNQEPFMGYAWAETYRFMEADGTTVVRWEDSPLARGLEGEETHDMEAVIPAANAGPRRVRLSGRPIRSSKGKITGAVMSATDITEYRDAEDALRELAETAETAERDLRHMVFAAAHTLQEPARGITSYVQLLERRAGDDLSESAREYMGHISDESRRMKDQISGLLHWLEVAQEPVEYRDVDLAEIAEDARREADENADPDETGLSPWINATDLPVIQGEPDLWREVFREILSNSLKFNQSALPQVEIHSREEDGQLLIEFADNGIGIDSADRERVFTLFERLHTLDEHSGYGIGLAVCRKVVRAHQGRIEFVEPAHSTDPADSAGQAAHAESSDAAAGSLLRITLPAGGSAAPHSTAD